MKTLIIYDSFFGNTEKIAQAIESALNAQAIRVSEVKPDQLSGLEMLIVGSPTRGFRPSPNVKKLLADIPTGGLKGVKVAAFDTRLVPAQVKNVIYTLLAGIFGYAAGSIAASLKKKGAALIVPPEGFVVLASEGPLKEGELARAVEWAKQIA